MKALVTGANGFTGSHLVKRLVETGNQVVGLVRPSSNLQRLEGVEVQLVKGDITARAALKTAMAGVDTVFHTAAYVELGVVDAARMERVNVEGTRAVLEVARISGVSKLVYCSTIGIFGDTNGRIVDETYQRQQKDFSSAYDRTKYQAQELVDRYAAEGFPAVSVLPAGILGPDDPHFGPVLQLFLQRKLNVWAGGDRLTGIVHVEDLVTAMLQAADLGQPGEHYIISAGELTTREMFAIISQKTGIPVPKEAPRWLVRAIGNLLDPIGRLTGWQPPLSRERVCYIYDRCVRVDATKARQQLHWHPRPPAEILSELVAQLTENQNF